MNKFKLNSLYTPCGDQPQAIEKLTKKITQGEAYQTLLGVTGSGKTFTMANVVAKINKPTLVISHNKTLAAQLYSEFKEFFPENAVEYFVSYYDYYQPEAYIPQTDTYIEKDASINDELDRLRLSATSSLISRRDVLIVASVSCIYNLGSPADYESMLVFLEVGQKISREEILNNLVKIQYERNDLELKRGKFRVRGDSIEIFPAYKQEIIKVEMLGDEIEKISTVHPATREAIIPLEKTAIYPAKHFVTDEIKIKSAVELIKQELEMHLNELKQQNKLLEAQRLEQRTRYDLEMLLEIGYCHGVENYSRALSGRPSGSRPYCLIDYFPEDFLTIIDESHVTVPQLNGMYNGDRARKETLVEFGFRLPSCLDNRPLRFDEFERLMKQVTFVSATPNEYEIKKSKGETVEQIIRPTGLLDPQILIKPTKGQVDDLINEIRLRAARKERILITTLTKRMAEDLSRYLADLGLRVKYLHSDIDTLKRVEILRDLRKGEFDTLVGINLLREGLDLPEVSLVAILDADKEGFLRSQTSLIQVAGRAARNINGQIIMYADTITASMKKAISETERRRKVQMEFNAKNNITPRSVEKAVKDYIERIEESRHFVEAQVGENVKDYQAADLLAELESEMELAARNLQFERAAVLRDQIKELKKVK